MYVCLCKGITDAEIREAVDTGATSLKKVSEHLGVATQCGKCACLARDIIADHVGGSDGEMPGEMFYNVA